MHTIPATVLLLCLSATAVAQAPLSDRWKETRRLDLKDKPAAYTDTIRLSDVSKEGMNLRKGAFQYRGQLRNDLLDFGGFTFGVDKQTADEIRLRDEEYIHIFSREQRDMSAADAASAKAGMDLPAHPLTTIDRELIQGRWNAYRRQGKNGPLSRIDYTTMIRALDVTAEGGSVYASGAEPLYTINTLEGGLIKGADKAGAVHSLTVWKLSKEELVLEDEYGIIYYMKQFR